MNLKRIGSFALFIALPAVATALFVYFTFGLLRADQERLDDLVFSKEMEDMSSSIEKGVNAAASRLDGVAAFWEVTPSVDADLFAKYLNVRFALDSSIKPLSIQWVDPSNVVCYAYPLDDAGRKIIGFDNSLYPNRLKIIDSAKATQDMAATAPVMLEQGYPGIILYQPIFKDGVYEGEAVGVFSFHDLLAETLSHYAGRNIEAWLRINDKIVPMDGHAIYTRDGRRVVDPSGETVPDPNAPTIDADTHVAPVVIADKTFDFVAVHQKTPAAASIPVIFVVFGLIFTLSVAAFVYLLDKERRRLHELAAREKDFVSLVSHQLRLPLTQLSWALDAMAEDAKLSASMRETMREMREIVRSSARLVSDLLNVSRIERGVLKIEQDDVPLAGLIEEALRALRPEAKAKGAEIDVDVPEGLTAYVDKDKAVEALRNIIDNAIKFGQKGVRIRVLAAREGGVVRLEIKDDGPGIRKAMQDKVFEKSSVFAKGGDPASTGIGLFLTKQFVDRMGGSVGFRTSRKGTTFIVNLPAERGEQD